MDRLKKLISPRSWPGILLFEEGLSGGAIFRSLWRLLENIHTTLWITEELRKIPLPSWLTSDSTTLNWGMVAVGLVWLSAVVWGEQLFKHKFIFGAADLLAIRIGPGDNLHIAPDGDHYVIDLGVFVRLTVSVSGTARTIPAFFVRLEPPVGEGERRVYEAASEKKLGDVAFYYYRNETDGRGIRVRHHIQEPMFDLVERLQKPLQPETHVEGWVRFEIKDFGHGDVSKCRVTVYAEDVHKTKYEIDTENIAFANLGADEYVANRHG